MPIPTPVAARGHIANLANVPTIAEPTPCTGCGFPLTSGECCTSWCDLAGRFAPMLSKGTNQ